jgi:predicted nucleotidyltransferase component of viral defense system
LLNLPEVAIEKDIWVTAVLRALFALPYADSISFKGGTSLSKCWNIIQRFSEDVDIAINREYFGFQGDRFTVRQISKLMRKACCKFCRETLQFDLAKQLIASGISEGSFSISMNITDVTTIDPEKIFIEYRSVFGANSYIRNTIVLEINGRSMNEPLEIVKVQSFIDEVFAGRPFVDKPFEIQVVSPERTFMEKICLLHEEFAKKEQGNIRVNRMSRHLYDIAMILGTPIADKALNDMDLYRRIVAHRRMFIAMKDFDYDTLLQGKVNIVPPEALFGTWEDDYEKMREMIYGDAPSFSTMIEQLSRLNERINSWLLPLQ